MRTTIKLEILGHGNTAQREWFGRSAEQPGVKRVGSFDFYGACFREYDIRGFVDYASANSKGSRGVYAYYFVTDGLYKVTERTSWKSVKTYYLLIENGLKTKMTFEEALAWLTKDTSE